VKVVSVFATVRDKQGKFVSTLTKDDFTLTEDGRSQTVRYFSRESDLPLTLGLLVDTSLSQRRVLGQEKTASYRFLDKVLRADRDKTFVIHFDRETELLQDLTSSRAELQKALDSLELPADQRPQMQRRGSGNSGGGYPGGGGGYPGGGGVGFPGGGIGFPGGRRGGGGMGRRGGGQQGGGNVRTQAGTTLYDAVLLASDEIMKKQTGRKALILLTDGVDHGSKTFLSDAIEAAQKTDTLVYSILFADDQAGGRGGFGRIGGAGEADGKKVLQRMSRETGGTFYEVSKKLSLDEIYDRLQEELRNQYSLGYSSDNPNSAAGYRTIRIAVRKSGLTVQSREGYYPVIH
jgi:VWFA-related protein